MTTAMRSVRAAISLALLASPSIARGQKTTELHGRVVKEDSTGVPGATITLVGLGFSVRADSGGNFRLSGTAGSTLTLAITASGFRDERSSVVLSRNRPVERVFILRVDTDVPVANPSDRQLRGRVTSTEGEPIAYANFTINGGRRFVTDDSGHFSVPFALSSGTLYFRRIGFEPTSVALPAMPDTAIRVRMAPVARALEAQTVTVRSPYIRLDLSGFYRRMAEVENGARVGYFVTPEDLLLRNPSTVTQAVEQFPSIRIRPIDDGKVSSDGMFHADGLPEMRRMRIEDRNGCPLTVYLDRVRIQPSIVGMKPVDERVNDLIQPHAVAGIEVYPRGIGAPREFPPYASDATCGVVLIWTK